MGKSAKKSAAKAGSAPAVVAPTKAMKKGKRDAEEIVEKQVVSSKKQKVVKAGVTQAIEKKKVKTKAQKKKAKKQESTPSEEDSSEPKKEKPTCEEEVKVANKPATKKAESSEESTEEEGSEDEEPSKPQAVTKTAAKKESSSEKPAKPVKKKTQTPAGGSKTLFVSNLNFKVQESDIINFLESAGEVVKVRLGMKYDRFAGYSHVEFATPAEAQEALNLSGQLLLDRRVRIDFAKERGNEGSSGEGLSVCIKGFGHEDNIDTAEENLLKHFRPCGDIARINILKDDKSGGHKGVAIIHFAESYAFKRALELSGTEVGGSSISVEKAKVRGDGGSGHEPNRLRMPTLGTGKKSAFGDE